MTELRIEHVYNCSEDTFWNTIFFDDDFNRRLYFEALRFPEYKEVRRDDKGDEVHRVLAIVPRLGDLPAPIKKAIGDNVSYEEHGVYDKKSRRYRIKVVPNKLSDKLTVEGELFTEPLSEGKCKRIFQAQITAKIFGIGGMLEKRLAADMEKSYDAGARFTNQYIAEKGLG